MEDKKNIVTTTFRVVPELLEQLDAIAEKLGFTRNALITKILWEYLEKRRRRAMMNDIEIDCTIHSYEELDGLLSTLTDRERKVLELRFGLKDGNPMTLEEVGKEFGVTRERIRQIEAKAIRKLKQPTRFSRIKDFLE